MDKAIHAIADKAARSLPLANNTRGEKKMAKSSLYDLNDHLFEQIEWLKDRDITGEALAEEIKRSEAVCKVSMQVLNNAKLLLDGKKAADNAMGKMKLPAMIEDKTR